MITETANAASRKAILALADSPRLDHFVRRHGMRLGAARFVAGESLDQLVPVLRRLNDQGLLTNTTLRSEPAETDFAPDIRLDQDFGKQRKESVMKSRACVLWLGLLALFAMPACLSSAQNGTDAFSFFLPKPLPMSNFSNIHILGTCLIEKG